MKIAFSVDVRPVPQPRPRVVHGHAYEPRRVSNYKKIIRTIAKFHMRGRIPINSPVTADIIIRRNITSTSKNFGDVDNHIKSVLDALNGICYTDDALVVRCSATKLKSVNEGVDITITDAGAV